MAEQAPVDVANRYVRSAHPDAAAAALAGSVATGTTTETSDLDIVVLHTRRRANYAETIRFDGWLIESFVYDEESLHEWFDREAQQRRAVAIAMWAEGIPLTDGDATADVQRVARERFVAGPAAFTPVELADRRYALSTALDDLEDARRMGEAYLTASDVFQRSAELLLGSNGRWQGASKWLLRRLDEFEDPEARRLIDWADDSAHSPTVLAVIARDVLTRSGGRLQEGHVRRAKT
jgi:predicted nucleotidyltransferase